MGKGGRCPETQTGRYARCETPKPSWGSSARGGTLESWVLRKAHARFGEGRMEKRSRSNSPAAYSTSTTAAPPGTASAHFHSEQNDDDRRVRPLTQSGGRPQGSNRAQ